MKDRKPAFHEDSVQSLFQELRERVREEGTDTYGEFKELVQELLQEKLNEGVFDVNEDLQTIESDLESRWPEIEATIVR
jgi:DNA-binding ferritin-like protein